jgi:hypothetical protein
MAGQLIWSLLGSLLLSSAVPASQVAVETQVDPRARGDADARADDWPVFRRDGLRSSSGVGLVPALRSTWHRSTLEKDLDDKNPVKTMHKPTTELIEKTLEKLAQRQQPVFPAMVPIAVGGKIIYRSYCSVVAVDAAVGSLEWKSMTVAGLDALLCDAYKKNDLRSWLTRYGDQSQENILFESSMIGTLSADHNRVYAIDDLALPAHPSGFGFGEPAIWEAMLSAVNRSRLVAINLETGKIDWERGQPVFDRSELAYSYFLGPPLPVAGMLYVMTEKKGDLQLACLNPEDGKHLWVMKLDKAGERASEGCSPQAACRSTRIRNRRTCLPDP